MKIYDIAYLYYTRPPWVKRYPCESYTKRKVVTDDGSELKISAVSPTFDQTFWDKKEGE